MKVMMSFYNSTKNAIRITYAAFVMIAIGYLITNENVNLFYTFKSKPILFAAELFLNIGEFLVMNLPIIFMLNIVCKKANSSSPVLYALVGYFTFLTTTMLFSNQSLGSSAYASEYGINSVFNITSGTRLPLETGLIGSILVAYATRMAFVFSRDRSSTSVLNFFHKDTAGVIYSILFNFIVGLCVSYLYPPIYKHIQSAITYIAEDLKDPIRIGLYGILDRVLSMMGLSNIIRTPFWYSSLGGSFVNSATGQSILGDVNIWTIVKNSTSSYNGAGRFITAYYIINMFLIPGFYVGSLISMTDRYERNHFIIVYGFASLLSIVAGNPLPVELLMLFTTPLLLVNYLIIVGVLFGVLVKFGLYLGFSTTLTNTMIAMPGSFPDFIINIRNIRLTSTLGYMCLVGVACFVLMVACVVVYYHFFAYDMLMIGKKDKLTKDIIEAIGGRNNIEYIGSGLFRLNIYLYDLEKVSVDKIQTIGAKRITETRSGVSIEFGASSHIIANCIKKKMKRKDTAL